MENALFPLKYMKVTQGVNGSYSHQGTLAIDFGNQGYKENLYAPFTGTIKKVYTASGNFVWLESNEKVKWADGTVDYMTVMTGHDDDVSDLYVGKVINQGELYYQQGTAGNATGIHVHLEVGKGNFTGSGWYLNSEGQWMINNAVHPVNALVVPNDVVLANNGGYHWQMEITTPILGIPVSRDEDKTQIEVLVDNLRCRKTPNGEILGYIKPGIYNVISNQKNGDYVWYQIKTDYWIAYSSDWANLYEASIVEPDESCKDQLGLLKVENGQLKEQIKLLEENTSTDQIQIYTCTKTDLYALTLNEGEILYIKK